MTVGFIGTGNMGGALAKAVTKTLGGANVLLTDRDADKASALAKKLGATAVDTAQVATQSDYIFLGVKPQMMAEMLGEIAPLLTARRTSAVLISMAAGLSLAAIREMVGFACSIIRIMPNTPVAVGQGMVLYCATPETDATQMDAFQQMMQAAGRLGEMEERLIDAASAVSGCGPAFVYLFIEALADGGVKCGLPRQMALDYAAQTVLGAAQMVLETGEHPGCLKDAVCSPGGTTIAGVHALECGGFRSLAMDAVEAAYARTLELAK